MVLKTLSIYKEQFCLLPKLPIKTLNIGQIIENYEEYSIALGIANYSKESFMSSLEREGKDTSHFDELDNYATFLMACGLDPVFKKQCEQSFCLLTGLDVFISPLNGMGFGNGDTVVKELKDVEEFNNFLTNLLIAYAALEREKDLDERPANEKMRKLFEQRRLAKEKIRQSKEKQQGEKVDRTIIDIHTDLVVGLHLPPETVNQMKMPYFKKLHAKMVAKESFDIGVQRRLAGDSKCELSHWMN